MDTRKRLIWLTLYAIAMANVEAVVVVHLRSLYYPDNPTDIFPLAFLSQRDLAIELARESATLMMILAVALLAAKRPVNVFAAFLYVFGVWDIFYYIWLKLIIGWPLTWTEWDLLFLIPWAWLGPWIAAVLVAILFVLWGAWILVVDVERRLSEGAVLLFVVGAGLVLTSFLAPAAETARDGVDALRNFRPEGFLWIAYVPGYLAIAAGLWQSASTFPTANR